MRRCDNCGNLVVERPSSVRVGRRIVHVCDDCLNKLVRSITMVERVTKRAAA